MRDIRGILERWGAWCRTNRETVYWYRVTPGFGRLFPVRGCPQPSCCDEDGIAVSGALAKLAGSYPDDYVLLTDYYLLRRTLSRLAQRSGVSVATASRQLSRAEELACDLLDGIPLQMDRDLSRCRRPQTPDNGQVSGRHTPPVQTERHR